MVLISLDNLDKNLDAAKSWLKSLNLKNLDRENKNSDLNVMDNLNTLKKLVSTLRTFLILIGLGCWDPQAYMVGQVIVTVLRYIFIHNCNSLLTIQVTWFKQF